MEKHEEAPDQIIKRTKAAIRTLRGEHVILDAVLAAIFGVETKRLNEQAKRNPGKFPEDFRFRLSDKEFERLKSKNATSKRGGTCRGAVTIHACLVYLPEVWQAGLTWGKRIQNQLSREIRN